MGNISITPNLHVFILQVETRSPRAITFLKSNFKMLLPNIHKCYVHAPLLSDSCPHGYTATSYRTVMTETGKHKDSLLLHQIAFCQYDMTLCQHYKPMVTQHDTRFIVLKLHKSLSVNATVLTCWWTLSFESKGTCIMTVWKEPIKPKPGPNLILHTSAEEISLADCSTLFWIYKPTDIIFCSCDPHNHSSQAGVSYAENLGEQPFVNGTWEWVNWVILGPIPTDCFNQNSFEGDVSPLCISGKA